MEKLRRADIVPVDLAQNLPRSGAGTLIALGDQYANRFGAKLTRHGNSVDTDGYKVLGFFIRPDGRTVTIDGASSGDEVYVDLLPECCAVEGRFSLSIKIIGGDIACTVRVIDGYAKITRTDEVVDPGNVIPSFESVFTDDAVGHAVDAYLNKHPISGGVPAVPDYWLTHLQERIPAIRSAMEAAGWEKSAFLWYHDVHWTYGYKRAPMLLKYLYQHTPINRTAFGGDIVDNEGDDTTMAYLWDWRDAVRGLPNHHSVPGNHDDGNSTDNRWDDPYIYAYLLAAEETPDVVRGDAGLYYYIDVPTEKTRYLYLDTATKDGNIINDATEQAWLKETLKGTPDGWHIVAIAHIWRTVDYTASPPVDAGWSYGGAYCLEQFDAYNARSGEYAACTGRVEFAIGGHTHVDADFVSDGGIPVILTEGDSRYVRSGLACKEGTITEASVNAIVADYAHGVVNVIRIGRGSSRVVNLDGSGSTEPDTPDVPDVPTGDFTNVLTEVGYSEGKRFSTSSLTDVDAAGWDITGYIPAKRGDIIRMANVDFLDLTGETTSDVSRAMVYLFDTDKGYITCSANYDPDNLMSEAWAAVYDADGDVIQFTLPTSYSSSVAYIRIGARNIDQYSVITVNEAIE